MLFVNKTIYKNNYQRAATYFLSTIATAPNEKQYLDAYNFMVNFYIIIYNDASIIGLKLFDDVTFEPWESQKGREKDTKIIRESIAKIELMIKELFYMIKDGKQIDQNTIQISNKLSNRSLQKLLSLLNVTNNQLIYTFPNNVLHGIYKLIEVSLNNIISITDSPIENKEYLYFSRLVFDPQSDWNISSFDQLLAANGRLIKLVKELEKRGYQRIDCRDGKKITLDYIKNQTGKSAPLKISWGERNNTGIEVSYEELRLEPAFIWLRIPMYKLILDKIDQLPNDVKTFLLKSTKKCDGCKYCVQTDKTHTRPLANVSVDNSKYCPYYPGFSMNWRYLDEELYNNILNTIEALDLFFKHNR